MNENSHNPKEGCTGSSREVVNTCHRPRCRRGSTSSEKRDVPRRGTTTFKNLPALSKINKQAVQGHCGSGVRDRTHPPLAVLGRGINHAGGSTRAGLNCDCGAASCLFCCYEYYYCHYCRLLPPPLLSYYQNERLRPGPPPHLSWAPPPSNDFQRTEHHNTSSTKSMHHHVTTSSRQR